MSHTSNRFLALLRSGAALMILALIACGPQGVGPSAGGGGKGDGVPPAAQQDDDFPVDPCPIVAGVAQCVVDEDRAISQSREYDRGRANFPDTHFELLDYQTRVVSQQSRGVCSIFSTVGYMEHLYVRAALEDEGFPQEQAFDWDFSEQSLQWTVKRMLGKFETSEGSNAAYNLEAIIKYGLPAEDGWPYQASRWSASNGHDECDWDNEDSMPLECFTNGNPPDEAFAADKYTLSRPDGQDWMWRWQMYVNTDRDAIMQAISDNGTGVVVGVDFFYQAWSHRRTTIPKSSVSYAINDEESCNYSQCGFVITPNDKDIEESHEHRAGHSIQLVGWVKGEDAPKVPRVDENGEPMVDADGNPVYDNAFFIFKNSWGNEKFGSSNFLAKRFPHLADKDLRGYGLISMDYIEQHGSAVQLKKLPEGFLLMPTNPSDQWVRPEPTPEPVEPPEPV